MRWVNIVASSLLLVAAFDVDLGRLNLTLGNFRSRAQSQADTLLN